MLTKGITCIKCSCATLGIGLAGHPANKNKTVWSLDYFEEYIKNMHSLMTLFISNNQSELSMF